MLTILSPVLPDNAANDAEACIAVIDTSQSDTSTTLLCKNLWRLARALHYSNISGDEEINSVLRRLQGLGEEESFSPKATKMMEQLAYYKRDCIGEEYTATFEPTPMRAAFQDPYCEYYNFGHDGKYHCVGRDGASL